jgi:hypothetical protein
MRHLIRLVETADPTRLDEVRVTVWSGATINVLHNPTKRAFDQALTKCEVLRGLISQDGRDLFLWDAMMAVHPNIIQELGLGNYDCIMYVRGRWTGPVDDPMTGRYMPAIERLTPKPQPSKQEIDDLLLKLCDDPDFAALMGGGE